MLSIFNREYSNYWFDFILSQPAEKLDWNYISCNSNLTMELIENNMNLSFRWKFVSRNKNLTTDFLTKHKTLYWDWNYIMHYSQLVNDILQYKKTPIVKHKWDWGRISFNKHLTVETIEKYPEKPWDWDGICYNGKLTEQLFHKYPRKAWNWHAICSNVLLATKLVDEYFDDIFQYCDGNEPYITFELINKHKTKEWNYKRLSTNSNITFNMVLQFPHFRQQNIDYFCRYNKNMKPSLIEKHPEIKWNFHEISGNPNFPIELVYVYPDKNWNWSAISLLPNLTFEFIEEFKEKPWDWYVIFRDSAILLEVIKHSVHNQYYANRLNGKMYWVEQNSFITLKIIEEHPHLDWNWTAVTLMNRITINDILTHPEHDWNYQYLCTKPDVTIELIQSHPDVKWFWKYIADGYDIDHVSDNDDNAICGYSFAHDRECWVNRALFHILLLTIHEECEKTYGDTGFEQVFSDGYLVMNIGKK